MYESYYSLTGMPFTISTNPRFMWWGEKHQEALANLRYDLLITNGYVVLTGDVGTGKTTLLNALTQSLDGQIHRAVINNPTLAPLEFFNLVANSYGWTSTISDKTEFLLFLDTFLRKAHAEGTSVLLVIDEAHCLSEALLGEIRLLSNIEENGTKLLTIFFVGQNEFQKRIKTSSCRALRERITLWYELKPLTEQETAHYIRHRLEVAGSKQEVFTPAAVRKIYNFSKGYPRLINILCDRSLLTGYVNDQKILDETVIDECARELRYLNPTYPPSEKYNLPGMIGEMGNAVPGSKNPREIAVEKHFPKSPLATVEERETASENTADISRGKLKEALTEESGGGGTMKRYRPNAMLMVAAALLVFASFQFVSRMKNESSVVLEPDQDEPKVASVGNVTIKGASGAAQTSVELGKTFPNTKKPQEESENEKAVDQKVFDVEKQKGEATDTAVARLAEHPDTRIAKEREEAPSSVGPTSREKEIKRETSVRISSLEMVSMALQQQDYAKAVDLIEAEKRPLLDNAGRYRDMYVSALTAFAGEVLDTQPEKALALLEKAAKLDPDDSNIHFSIGKTYTKLQRYNAAIEAYQEALLLNSTLVDAFFNVGFLFATIGNYEEAERYFTQAVELQPAYLDKALFNLAIIQEKMGKYDSSLMNLQKAVDVEPKNQKAAEYLRRIIGEPTVAGDR